MIKERFLNPEIPEEKDLLLRQKMEKTLDFIDLSFDLSIKEKIKQNYLSNDNFALLLAGNHQSHADIFPYIKIADQLTNFINQDSEEPKLKGFNMVIAFSLTTGHQDKNLKDYYRIIKEICSEKHIEFIPIVRPKDKEKYGISDVINFPNLRKAVNSHKDGCALIEFPEGTVKGGRVNLDTGLPYGLQPANESNITDYCVSKYLKKGVNFGVLPVAINGTYKLYPPDTYQIMTPDEKVKVVIGSLLEPLSFQNLQPGVRPSDLLMQSLIPLLSVENQGSFYPRNNL